MIHMGELVKLRLKARPLDFLAGQGDKIIEVTNVTILQQGVTEHRGQCGSYGHCQTPIHPVAFQSLKDFEQWDVCFGNRFVEPIFFEEILVFGMAHKGQMSVQNQTEIAERHNVGPLLTVHRTDAGVVRRMTLANLIQGEEREASNGSIQRPRQSTCCTGKSESSNR